MFKLAAYLSAVMFIFSFFMNMNHQESNANSAKEEDSGLDFIYKATLSNRALSGNRSWFHVGMIAIISFLAIYFIR